MYYISPGSYISLGADYSHSPSGATVLLWAVPWSGTQSKLPLRHYSPTLEGQGRI